MRTLLAAILIINTPLYGQVIKFNHDTGRAQAQEVIECTKSVTELYNIAQRWVAEAFVNPDNVVSANLKDEMIKGTGATDVKFGLLTYGVMTYVFTIDFKENKTRITITNFNVKSTAGSYSYETYVYKKDGSVRTNSQATSIADSAEPVISSLINSYKSAVLDQAKKSDDW